MVSSVSRPHIHNDVATMVKQETCLESISMETILFDYTEMLWNTQLRQAELYIQECFKTYPNHILLHKALTETACIRSQLNDCEETFTIATKVLRRAQKVASEIISARSPRTLRYLFSSKEQTREEQFEYLQALVVLSEIYFQEAVLLIRKQHYVTGGYQLRKAWTHIQNAYSITRSLVSDSFLKEIQATQGRKSCTMEEMMFLRVFLGVAIFNYFVSKLPPVLRWVVELLGFEGNRDRAINTFEVVCDLETPQQPLAKLLMISLKWFFFEEQDEALTMLQDLQHRYPRSPIMARLCGGIYRKGGNIEASSVCFEAGINHCPDFPQFQLALAYELGHNYFLCHRYCEAVPLIESYLKDTKSKRKGLATFELGLCLWMRDIHSGSSNSQAQKAAVTKKIVCLYQQLPSLVRKKMPWDLYAQRKATEFLRNGNSFTHFDTLFFPTFFLVEACKWESARDRFSLFETRQSSFSAEERALLFYLQFKVYRELDELNQAEKALAAVTKCFTKITVETWILPCVHLELCQLCIGRGDYNKAELALQQVKKHSGFDFEKQVHSKHKKLRSKLSRLQKSRKRGKSS